jgi:elongation factor P
MYIGGSQNTEKRREHKNMLESGDLKKGVKIEIDGEPYILVQFEFVKPGKGQALYKCKLKNMVTGAQFDRTFRSGEKFKQPDLEEQEMEYLYAEGDQFCFMNMTTYVQEYLTEEQLGEAKDFLKENTVCNILLFEGRPIGISLPIFINLKVEETEPWVKGDTASGDSKPATLETGYVLQVPPFIEKGELLKIDTRTGAYVERVKE